MELLLKLYAILFPYIDKFIVGDFKWTLLGVVLVLLGLGISLVVCEWIKPMWIKVLITVLIMGVFVWFGHSITDPYIHKLVDWYTTPIDEPMHIIKKCVDEQGKSYQYFLGMINK